MKINLKEILTPTIVLFVICVVVSALLGLTNFMTEDKIAEVQAENAAKTRMLVLPEADEFTQEGEYYTGLKGGEVVGYVFETEAGGYGGKVKVMTGISAQGEIMGISILSHSETPGLGANATKESFTDQFKQPAAQLEVVKNQAAAEGQIEAMTGATITTKAVANAVNEAVAIFESVAKGGN